MLTHLTEIVQQYITKYTSRVNFEYIANISMILQALHYQNLSCGTQHFHAGSRTVV